MLTFNLKSDSWHMWVANFGDTRIGNYKQEYGTDICTYTRAFLLGAFWLFVTSAACLMIAAWIGFSLWDIGAFILGYVDSIAPWSLAFLVITFSLLVGIGYAYSYDRYQHYKHRKWEERVKAGVPPPQPGFVTLAYHKFKDKTCFKINFTKEN